MTSEEQGAPPPPREPARLYRSRSDRMIGGVCAGIANYLGVDVAIIRIAAVVLALAGGSAILAYIIGWILIPEAPPGGEEPRARAPGSSDNARILIGAILVAGGALWLISSIVPWVFDFRGIGPLILVGIGILLVVQGAKR